MKKLILFLSILALAVTASFAQAPQKFTYQAVVRNESNTLVRGNVGVRISILQGGANGTMVYQETHTTVTNTNGLMTLQIGGGTVMNGDFAAIDWATGPYFLKTETDPTGGTNYTIEGTQQLLSVPYALYAGNAANSFSGSYNDLTDQPNIPTVPTNVSAFTNDAGYITMDSVPAIPTNVSAFVNDAGYVTESTLTTENYITQNDLITNNYVTEADIPTNVSAFTNDAGYITMDSVPVIPANVSAFVNDAGYVTESTLTTENYITQNDLITNNYVTEADIPTNVSAFTNDAGYITMDSVPTIPTNVSYFTNDAGYVTESTLTTENYITQNDLITNNYVTEADIPTNVSAFNNDAGYITMDSIPEIPTIPTNVSVFTNDANYITLSQVPAQVNADWDATTGAAKILNKPTIPTVPTNVSSFTNDANYVTVGQIPTIPTLVSTFENDAHYITEAQLQQILTSITAMQNTIDSLAQVIEDLNNQVNPPVPTLGTVITLPVESITPSSVVAGGNVTANGHVEITARGVCWSTSNPPTIADNHTTDGTGVGEFTSTVSGLSSSTTYYLCAYVTNEIGTAYGEVVTFTTAESSAPIVTTSPYNDLLATTVTCGGNVLSDGGMEITSRGICWSDINPTPTIYNNVVEAGAGTGEFTVMLTGLTSATTYHVRAYATNGLGTTYGEAVTFTTIVPVLPTVTTSPVTDILPYTATFHGEVVSNGGAMLSARGFCYGTSHNPTVAGDHTEDGIAPGVFESTVNTLQPTTTYYVRAYATNLLGTVYGEETSFTSSTTPPGVTTDNVTNITQTSASCGGAVTYAGGAAVTAKGLCYGTSENPTTDDNTIAGGTGIGAFTGELTGLISNTTYYVRAYATNSVGTNYGEQRTFTTLPYLTPTVAAVEPTNVSYYSFTCGGNVTDAGTYAVTARGLCWANTPEPTVSNPYIALGTGTGSFSHTFTELTPNTTYYVRAYAVNSVGIAYSEQMEVTTLANTAPVVATESASSLGVCRGNVTSDGGLTVSERGFCYSIYQNPTIYDNYIAAGSGFGTYTATLPDLVGGTTYYVKAYATNDLGTTYGEQRSFTRAVLPTVTTTAASSIAGTTATSGGNVTSDGGATVTARGVCWSTSHNPTISNSKTTNGTGTGSFTSSLTGLSLGTTYYVRAYATNGVGTAYGSEVSFTTVTLPTVTTTATSSITDVTATSGGNVTNAGGGNVTARGVCWSTSHNPTINNSKTTNGTGTGSFTSSLTGLTPNTLYYVRAYATNAAGTAYGSEVSFTPNCNGGVILTDRDGNTYNVVQIGSQCWMKENLRTTKYADGTSISQGSTSSEITAYWYYPNDNSANKSTYGLLYNWKAVMRNSSSSSTNPSGVQGICPTGWHVPSAPEWMQLKNYVASQSEYLCEGTTNGNYPNIAKSLAGTTGWDSSTNTCAVGNTPSDNNATGFSALPAGRYKTTTNDYISFGQSFKAWSTEASTSTNTSGNHLSGNYTLTYDNASYNYTSSLARGDGISVRCVRD